MTAAKSNKSIRRNKSVKRTGKALVKPGNRQKTLPNEDTFWPGRNFHKEFDSKCTQSVNLSVHEILQYLYEPN